MTRLCSFCAIVASASDWLEEQQRVRILALDRRADAAEVLHDELREEVAKLRRLGLVGRGVVLHGLRPPDVVDADDERLDAGRTSRPCGS